MKAIISGILLLLLHSVYALIVHLDLQHGTELLQYTTIIIDPIATWLCIHYDLSGPQFFGALLIVGGSQWFVLGTIIGHFRNRRHE